MTSQRSPDGKSLLTPRMRSVRAAVLDTDGVITDTASVHAAAWKQAFDTMLREIVAPDPAQLRPFDPVEDYRLYVDGKSRMDGAVSFLASRGIELPMGHPTDAPGRSSVHAVAARKDEVFRGCVERYGVSVWPGTLRLVAALRRSGVQVAAVSASRHAREVLTGAGVVDRFDEVVDGRDCERLGLPGKPDPAMFTVAAERLGQPPARTALVEDALAGVEAGRRGGFGLVIAVDRSEGRRHEGELSRAGADLVVGDLSELLLPDRDSERAHREERG